MILNYKLNHGYKLKRFKQWFISGDKQLELQGLKVERFKLYNEYAWEQYQKGLISHPQPGFLRSDKRVWVIILTKK